MKQFYQTIRKSILMSVLLAMISTVSFAGITHFNTVWQGENGQNHMNFLVVSAILEDLPLSVNDEIAVFSGLNCVGVTQLTQAIDPADNTTFISISASEDDGSNNGFIDNDTIVFKIWDNINQKEMIAKAVSYRNEVSNWSINGKYTPGATSVVEIVSFVELTQSIDLIKGYNMISTYVTAENPDASVVTESLRDGGLLIKMLDEAGNSYENWGNFGGWINNIGSVSSTEGYKIKVAEDCSFQVTGRPIVLPFNIPLKAGWNIISFPRSDDVDALSVVQSLIDQNLLIKVQDESGNSIENWGVFGGWKNNIGSFGCCKAYKIKMNGDAILTIQENYLKSAIVSLKTEKTEYFSTKFEGNGSDHMNINLVGINKAGLSAGDELAAFDGNICVGTLKLTSENQENGTASLVASSSTDEFNLNGFGDGNPVKIYMWNKQSGNVSPIEVDIVSGQLVYEKNASILAKMKSSTTGINSLNDLVKIDLFPNPCAGKVTVRFSELPEQGSRIDILDLSGRKVSSRLISGFSEDFNLEALSSGIYLVKTKFGSSENIQKLKVN